MPEPRIRVVVYLDRAALEDLEDLIHYRHGHNSRSAVVREAIMWLRAKEAGWLLRAERAAAKRREHAVREAELKTKGRAQVESDAINVM